MNSEYGKDLRSSETSSSVLATPVLPKVVMVPPSVKAIIGALPSALDYQGTEKIPLSLSFGLF